MGRAVGVLSVLLLSLGASDALAQNIVQNPGFDGGLGGWTPLTSPNYTVGWDAVQGNAAAGAVTFDVPTSAAGTEIYILSQCVLATGGTLYDVSGSFRYPGSAATVPSGGVVVQSFTDAGCTTSAGLTSGFGLSSGATPPDTWVSQSYVKSYMTPAATVAVRVLLRINTFAAGTFAGWFDDIAIVPSTLDYYTLAPCRLLDTRDLGAPIGGPVLDGQTTRTFTPSGNCGIPGTAKALSVNVAVTQPTSGGNIRLFPGGQPVPTVSSINYSAGQTRTNNGVVTIGFLTGSMSAFVGQPAGTSVHLILDVTGYFE